MAEIHLDSKTPVLIVGTDSEARMALDVFNALDVVVYGFLTENEEEVNREINDVLVVADLGSKDSNTLLDDEHAKLFVVAREVADRRSMAAALDGKKPEVINAVHPTAVVSPYAQLGISNLLYPQVVVQPNVKIGSFNLIQTAVSLDSEAEIGNLCTIQAGARIGKGTLLDDEVFVGMGAVIQSGLEIGKGAIIAPGAVVLTNVDEGETVFGNPARPADQ